MLRLLFGMHLVDVKSGFFVCDRDVFADLLRRRFSYAYYQTLIIVAACHKGYRVEQIETLFEERKLGTSFISALPLRVILRTLVDVAKGLVEFRLQPAKTEILDEFLAEQPVASPPEPLAAWRRAYLRLFALLMPLHHWVVSFPAYRYYRQLRRTQWLSPDAIRALQERRLRVLIKHAYRHVPYYRDLFDRSGIDPDSIKTLDDLPRLPVLTKDDIRRNLHFDLVAEGHDKRRMVPITTSGSTGEPLILYADKTQLEMRWATTLRNIEWTGYRFGDRQVRLWHSTIGMSGLQACKERLDAWLSRRTFFPAFAMDEAGIARYLEVLRARRPALIDGYAEAFHLIASYLGAQRVDGVRPKGIISSAQTLSRESRQVIEEAFQTQVFDKYGSREFSGIAHECEAHRGHHVNAESYIVEIMRDGRPARPGETGEVLVTDLNNTCLPLIRYALGDLATATDPVCPCGRGLPLIGEIQGRTQAIIIGTNGCFLPGTFFAHLLKDYGHIIKQFQVVQERLGAMQFKVVSGARFSQPELDKLLKVVATRAVAAVRDWDDRLGGRRLGRVHARRHHQGRPRRRARAAPRPVPAHRPGPWVGVGDPLHQDPSVRDSSERRRRRPGGIRPAQTPAQQSVRRRRDGRRRVRRWQRLTRHGLTILEASCDSSSCSNGRADSSPARSARPATGPSTCRPSTASGSCLSLSRSSRSSSSPIASSSCSTRSSRAPALRCRPPLPTTTPSSSPSTRSSGSPRWG